MKNVMTMKNDVKCEEELTCRFKIDMGNWQVLTGALESLINLNFNVLLLSKVYIVWAKKVQRSYLSWHWKVIQNLERHRFVVLKLTLGIWQILTWALESLKNFTLMGSFWTKHILFELKKYRGVVFHDTEEWYKIWSGINLSFQNWHEEFDKFWLEHLKVSKIFTLMGSFWTKYILFKLKKYRGVIFHDTEEWYKIWRKTHLWFGKWHEEFGKFSLDHLKVSKLGLWWDPLAQSRKCLSLKFTEELCVMTVKNDAKFEQELTLKI